MWASKSLFLENWAVWWESKTACLSSLKQNAFPNKSWHDTSLRQLWKWPKISRAQVQDQCPSSCWTCASRAQCVTQVPPCQQCDRLRRQHEELLSLQYTKKYCSCESTWKAIMWWETWIRGRVQDISSLIIPCLCAPGALITEIPQQTNLASEQSWAKTVLAEKMKSLLLILLISQSLISMLLWSSPESYISLAVAWKTFLLSLH